MDDEHCDMCGEELKDDSGAVKLKKNQSYSTTIYLVCGKCFEYVDEYIQDCRNSK